MKRIRVLVVDDSAVVREVLSALIASDPELELFGAASDPIFAMQKMAADWPDVMVLDIEMPRMDGITFMRKLQADGIQIPTVICSSVAEKDAAVTFEALDLGAVEIITKPKLAVKDFLIDSNLLITDAIKAAAQASLNLRRIEIKSHTVTLKPGPGPGSGLIALGASTGGTIALETILKALPPEIPPILIVQHMPENFTAAFAARLNKICRLEIAEARDGDALQPGRALIAPGNYHMQLHKTGQKVQIFQAELVKRHRPSVDVLFKSIAEYAQNALGVILTGMGDDGAAGLLAMRRAGMDTIAQDRLSSVVFGMPAEAARLGAAARVLGLAEIPEAMTQFGAGSL
jgi:two-component system chemotaxis response regulator CheB